MRNWNIHTHDDNLTGDLLKFENYLKFGKELIVEDFNEENFIKNSKDNLRGFGIDYDTKVLHMFADTYELIASTRKGLSSIDGQFYVDMPSFEYVFGINNQFYGIFYTVSDNGVDYRYKVSIVKKDMTQEEGIQILRKLVKDYVNHRKQIQEKLFKTGEKVLDDVILPEELKQSILDDIRNFLRNRKKYAEFGMVWKRGYIFHGPPGNGKTLFLRKLGGAFGLSMTDMTNRITTDGTLSLPQHAEPYENGSILSLNMLASGGDDENPPEIYYLEDMEKVIGKNNDDFGRITLSNFLTAIDGVSRLANGLILIGTTNHKDRLENSILGRPGRFDRVYEFAKPTNTEINKFFERRGFLIKNKKVTAEYSDLMMGKNFSMAFVEDFILSCVTKVDKKTISASVADSIIKDLEQYNKLETESNLGFNK